MPREFVLPPIADRYGFQFGMVQVRRHGDSYMHRPWSLVVALELPSESEAVRFEKYLKSGSGRALAKRHFGPVK